MSWARSSSMLVLIAALLSACGGGDQGTGSDLEAARLTRTAAYVLTDCQSNHASSQSLMAISGDGDPVRLASPPASPPLPQGLCEAFGQLRAGPASVVTGFLQRFGVSPDGRQIVFEVTDDFAHIDGFLDWRGTLPAEQEGIFVVQSDGTGLRRLGNASRAAWFRFTLDLSDVAFSQHPGFAFSPDGTRVAYSDMGPDPSGAQGMQVFTMRVADGATTQQTCLAPFAPLPNILDIVGPVFVDNDTVAFGVPRSANDVGLNLVKTDGSCNLITRPPPIALPGASVVPAFAITGAKRFAYGLFLPDEEAVNPTGMSADDVVTVEEIFVESAASLLQLTDYRRVDTGDPLLTADGTRVIFESSVDLGENAHNTCQLFSVSTLGGEATQLTHFDSADMPPPIAACINFGPPGCGIESFGQDLTSDVVLFYSSCDPFGTTPEGGGQLFAMRSDGSGLRQLTSASGYITHPDGSVTVQLPGPFVYSPAFPTQ